MAKWHGLWAVASALLVCAVPPAGGEDVVEVWRTPLGRPRCVSADTSDGSCWIAAGSAVIHVAHDGTTLGRKGGFLSPASVSANSADHSCWVADRGRWDGHSSYIGTSVTHLAADGTVLWQGGPFDDPDCVSVNTNDGSVWVAEASNHVSGRGHVVHLAPTGAQLYRGAFPAPDEVSVDPTDGSCWVAGGGTWNGESYDPGIVAHLSAAGTQISSSSEFTGAASVCVDPADGSCWVADCGRWDGATYVGSAVIHLSRTGEEVWRGGGLASPVSVSVDPTDSSCWVVDHGNGPKGLVHLSAAGAELWSSPGWPTFGFDQASADPTDGSCWAIDNARDRSDVVHVAATGTELWRGKGLDAALCVSVSPLDGSCWVTDSSDSRVLRVGADGEMLWSGGAFYGPWSVSANTADGSCWVADTSNAQVVHLSRNGAELWRSAPMFDPVGAVAADPVDGSCWVAGTYDDVVLHLAEDGSELWRGTTFDFPVSLSVNPIDGSCWIANGHSGQVVHLAATGAELWSGGGWDYPHSVSVNLTDGSCWVADYGSGLFPDVDGLVTHLSASGVALWSSEPLVSPSAVSVNPIDGSCWVADAEGGQVMHFAADGTELWRSAGAPVFARPTSVCVDPEDGSCWVADQFYGEVIHLAAITAAPVADFVALPTRGAVPLSATFAARSPYTPTSWAWDFGDGASSAQSNPTHIYTAIGSYTVSLTVANRMGSDTESKPDHITVTAPAPTADFTAAPVSGILPLTVTFTDTSTNGPFSWSWDFGDGGTSTDQHPTHSYQKAGRYAVSLTANNEYGSDTETKAAYITVLFIDVAADYWACDEVMACVDAGIVAGYPNGTYAPATEVTRDQMAVYLARALAGGDAEVPAGPEAPSFADVPHTGFGDDGTDPYWAYKYIEYCAAHNVVLGYPGGDYKPTETVDRGQMAVYVARALVAPAGDAGLPYPPVTGSTFTDVTPDSEWRWCYQHVEYLAAEETVQGYWDGTYRPEETVTRDQMAVYVARAFELLP